MFEKGDLIIYGKMGVCRVQDITKIKIKGLDNDQLYYVLETIYSRCKISTPVDNTSVVMRPILTREEANALIDSIPGRDVDIYENKGFRQLSEEYESVLNTCDCNDLISLTMSIHQKKNGSNDQGFRYGATDDRFLKAAEELLFGELAASLEIERDEVQSYIQNRLESKS